MTAKHKAAIKRGIRRANKAKAANGKKHWTQTPKGREHMKLMAMRRQRKAKQAKKHPWAVAEGVSTRGEKRSRKPLKQELSANAHDPPRISFHAAYLLGKVETLVEFYAASKGLSPALIAAELGELLRHSESR